MTRITDLPIPLDTARLRRLSVLAECDPRTLVRLLRGERIRSADVARRIRRVCLADGVPVPETSEASR
jgi:hypothetical protein